MSKKVTKNFSRGTRKHIRRAKAHIRHEFLDENRRKEEIAKLYRNLGVGDNGELARAVGQAPLEIARARSESLPLTGQVELVMQKEQVSAR